MANDLTGEFDVVAEFAIPAANRVLAAMHCVERFQHAMTLHVEDVRLPGTPLADPAVVAVVDGFGEPAVDHGRIPPRPRGGMLGALGPSSSRFDAVVNPNFLGSIVGIFEPSKLKGRAQLQLAPPTIEVPDNSGKNVTIRIPVMARYLADPNTPRVAEYIRGNIAITAPVSEVASENAHVVAIDIKGHAVISSFTSLWSNTPILAEDLAGANQLITNAIRTSFLPSNAIIPSDISHVRFKTLRGSQDALAVLLNMAGDAGNPGSQQNVFLGAGDDFALGAGIDFIRGELKPEIDEILNTPVDPVSFSVTTLLYRFHITYTFQLTSVTVNLVNGNIVLTIEGDAATTSWTPNFHFTVTQKLTLTPSGSTAELVVGDLSLDTDNRIINRFRGGAESAMRRMVDKSLARSKVQDTVRTALDADKKLGKLLASLLKPAKPKEGVTPPPGYVLAYTSAEIRDSGIVMHGIISVADWPEPHVEFEKISPNTAPSAVVGGVLDGEPEYTALKSWIPGGMIERYEWTKLGLPQPLAIDENRFVFIHPPPELVDAEPASTPVHGFGPMCLRVKGTRLSASWAVQPLSVTATECGFHFFPVLSVDAVGTGAALPMIALTHPDSEGGVHVAGHTAARLGASNTGIPNMIVHFADDKSAGQLDELSRALRESGREDTTTAILAIMTPEQLLRTRHAPGIVYSDDDPKVWERAYRLDSARPPLTVVLDVYGKVVWSQEGEIDSGALAGALRRVLVAGGPVKLKMVRATARPGSMPPNFLFEHSAGSEVTLRKIAGKPTAMVFWRSTSRASIDAVRDWQHRRDRNRKRDMVVLAINDGEPADLAKRAATENGITTGVVTDPDRRISRAYGVNVWPTVVQLDERGLISSVAQGRAAPAMSSASDSTSQEKGA